MLANLAELNSEVSGCTGCLEAALELGPRVPAAGTHLENQLRRRLGSRVRSLRAIVRHDGVILQGIASSYHAKQLAQHAAMDLTDLPLLANEIEVRYAELSFLQPV